MLPATYDLKLYRGDTYRQQFVLWADSAKTIPVDLTDVTVKSEIRDKPGGTTIIELTVNPVSGNSFELVLSGEQTRDLPAKGAWDIQLTWPNADITTVIAGPVSMVDDVTDSTETTVAAMMTKHRQINAQIVRRVG